MTTQRQYDVLRQPTRELYVKIDILNREEKIIDNFKGIATDGNISIDAESTYRRSGNITVIVDRDSLLPAPESSVWLDKRCKISVGVTNYSNEIVWFNLGRFAMTNVNASYEGSHQSVQIELKDYMAFLDGTLGGELSHQIVIGRGEATIAYALRSVLSDLGRVSIDRIGVDNIDAVVPYDIEKPSGTTVYEVADELVSLYKGYDFYFNAEGYLIVEKIRDHRNSPIVEIFDGSSSDLTVSRSNTFDFANVRNAVRVWGEQNDDGTQPTWQYRNRYTRQWYDDMLSIRDAEHGDICYIENSNVSYMWSNLHYVGIATSTTSTPPQSPRSYEWSRRDGVNGIRHEGKYVHIRFSDDGGNTFTEEEGVTPGDWIGTYMDENYRSSKKVEDYTWTSVNNTIATTSTTDNVFVRFSSYSQGGRHNGEDMQMTPSGSGWELLGFNVVPRFNMEKIGEKMTVVSSGTTFNDEQAMLEAEYELEKRSNFAETISISTVPLYYLDVNKKIRVKSEDTGVDEYLITGLSIPLSLSSTMTVTARKLFRAETVELEPINRIVVDSVSGRVHQWDIGVADGIVELNLEEKPKGTTESYVDSNIIKDIVTSKEYEWSMGLNDGVPFVRLNDKDKGVM